MAKRGATKTAQKNKCALGSYALPRGVLPENQQLVVSSSILRALKLHRAACVVHRDEDVLRLGEVAGRDGIAVSGVE